MPTRQIMIRVSEEEVNRLNELADAWSNTRAGVVKFAIKKLLSANPTGDQHKAFENVA